MFKNYLKILSNPLLFYIDKSGNSVFRNYCLVKETGNLYRTKFQKADVGKTLEFRFKLDGYLKLTYFFATVVLYFIFIHIKYSFIGLLFFELIWILTVTVVRYYVSCIYREYLLGKYGVYEVVEFDPPIPKRKTSEFIANFRSKIIIILLCLALFLFPSVLLQLGMKYSLNPKFNGFKSVLFLSNVYNALYPKYEVIYDMRAYAHFMLRDYEGALMDYKKALELSGKDFSNRDFTRFANLLLVQKRVTNAQDSIDVFNEYMTQKKMTVLEQEQMLWIKSIFKIENSIVDTIYQDYDDMLASVDEKDIKNQFYIKCDKAYMLYLMKQYDDAINEYNVLISYAKSHKDLFANEIKQLYAERGWAYRHKGNTVEANADFLDSQTPLSELPKLEPSYASQKFVVDKF